MSEPTYGEFLRNRIVDALASADSESDAEIEALLDSADKMEVTEEAVERIVQRAFDRSASATDKRHAASQPRVSASTQPAATSPRLIRQTSQSPNADRSRTASVFLAIASLVAAVALFATGGSENPPFANSTGTAHAAEPIVHAVTPTPWRGLYAKPPLQQTIERVNVGDRIVTAELERRRLTLPDGSVLYVNASSDVDIKTARRVHVNSGEVFVEVVPASMTESERPFVVTMPGRRVTALGTRFGVSTKADKSGVLVTQGKVRVSGFDQLLTSGQKLELKSDQPGPVRNFAGSMLLPAPRASASLDWTQDLMAAVDTTLIPESEHKGGAIEVVDTNGQKVKLSLRKFHVDVHIEDGFARTTIDQTYFNHQNQRLEGTFYFPLPGDASISRLAMYVNGTLMEGGMLERDRARNVFEQIRHTRRDPALLEWVDGSTFKMRVFPLEARQEKRIVLSYTQRLPNDYGRTQYRFPAGHNLELVNKWTTSVRIAGGADSEWKSASHTLKARKDKQDLVIEGEELNSTFDRDLLIEVHDNQLKARKNDVRLSTAVHGRHKYLMLRYRPELEGELKRKPRNCVFLFEASGNRDPLLARVQIDVVKTLLENAEHADTFSIVRAGTRSKTFKPHVVECSRKNVKRAIEFLEKSHLIGAFDFGKALETCEPFYVRRTSKSVDETVKKKATDSEVRRTDVENFLVHVGSAVPVMGERDEKKLAQRIPEQVRYVGIGVGKRWSRHFMKMAASRSGGFFTQINPDEKIEWRSFELFSTLNAPRLLNVQVNDAKERFEYRTINDAIAQGQELCTIARMPSDAELPDTLIVSGKLNGKTFKRELRVRNVVANADYLPRTWARLEIDRLIAAGAEKHKQEMIALSKAMYVMSPFTSLLVLENEAMYAQFNVDRGREDHWALYNAPKKIPVVHEPLNYGTQVVDATDVLHELIQERQQQIKELRDELAAVRDNVGRYEIERRTTKLRAVQRDLEHKTARLERVKEVSAAIKDEQAAGKHTDTVVFRNTGATPLPSGLIPATRGLGLTGMPLTRQQRQLQLVQQLNRQHLVSSDFGLQQRIASYEMAYRMQTSALPVSLFDVDLNGTRDVRTVRMVHVNGMDTLNLIDPTRQAMQTYTVLPQLWGTTATNNVDSIWVDVNGQPNWSMPVTGTTIGAIRPPILTGTRIAGVDSNAIILGDGSRRLLGNNITMTAVDWQRLQTRGYRTAFSGGGVGGGRFGSPNYGYAGSNVARFVNPNYARVPLGWAAQDLRWDKDFIIDPSTMPQAVRWRSRFGRNDGGFYYTPIAHNGRMAHWGYITPDSGVVVPWVVFPDVFGDILSQAPGMESSAADTLALIAAKATDKPKLGDVDPAAAKLINNARSTGWKAVTVKSPFGDFQVRYDGRGRMRFNRALSAKLREQFVHDGETLWHVYPDLMLGAKRTASRFHRRDLQNIIPWLVSSVEDLRVGAHVRLLDDDTVSVEPVDRGKGDKPFVVMRLKFKSGRLVERRIVEMPSGKTLGYTTFDADGTVVARRGDGSEVDRVLLRPVKSFAEPQLLPVIEEDTVVLPLPYRSIEHTADMLDVTKPLPEQLKPLSDDDCMRLVATLFANKSQHFGQLVTALRSTKHDLRAGLIALRFLANPSDTTVNFDPKHRNTAIGRFFDQHRAWLRNRNISQEMHLPEDSPKYFQHLVEAHNLHRRWASGELAQAGVREALNDNLHDITSFICNCKSPRIAQVMFNTLNMQLKPIKDLSADAQTMMANTAGRLADDAPLSPFTEPHAYWLARSGEVDQALKVYSRRVKQLSELGGQFRTNDEIHKLLAATREGRQSWHKMVKSAMQTLAKLDARVAVLHLSSQADTANDKQLAKAGLNIAVDGVDLDKHPQLLEEVMHFHRVQANWRDADECFKRLISLGENDKNIQLWHTGAAISHSAGDFDTELRRLERALELEYESWPDKIVLATVQQKFGQLLDKFAAFAAADKKDANENIPLDFVDRVIMLADRWRSLDPDITTACNKAAAALHAAGFEELAWDYWTTPLALKPNEASAWLALAKDLQAKQLNQLADHAYGEAFAAEPTNGQILWDHANLLRNDRQHKRSRELLKLLVDQTWQPRFRQLQAQARQLLDKADAWK